MKFTYAGSQFQLEFERKTKPVTLRRRKNGESYVESVDSKFPFTTARLLTLSNKVGVANTIAAEATVGCAPMDKFSNEEGRRQALRKLTATLRDRKTRTAVWDAYHNRGNKDN